MASGSGLRNLKSEIHGQQGHELEKVCITDSWWQLARAGRVLREQQWVPVSLRVFMSGTGVRYEVRDGLASPEVSRCLFSVWLCPQVLIPGRMLI